MAIRTDSLTIRIAPRVKYLAEIAARARGCSLTSYIQSALEDSFKKVTLRVAPEPEPIYGQDSCNLTKPDPPDEEEERVANEVMSVANLANDLWNESEFRRLQSLEILAPHILPEEDRMLLQYLHTQEDLKTRASRTGAYKLNRDKIIKEWEAIKRAFNVAQVNGSFQWYEQKSPLKAKRGP